MSGKAVEVERRQHESVAPSAIGDLLPFSPDVRPLQRVILAAGGTAGHLYPGVAVAQAIVERFPHCQLLFVGTRHGVEGKVVPPLGYPLRLLHAGPYYGVGPLSRLRGVFDLSYGFLQARSLVQEFRPDLVIGFGGFTSVTAVAAAASLGVPTAIHESNVSPGMATALLSRIADEVYVGVRDCGSHFRRETVFTGNPVRPEIAQLSGVRRLPIRDGRLRLLVTTGSMGEGFLNHRVPELVQELARRGCHVEVWQQAGSERDLVEARYQGLGLRANVEEFITDMPKALGWADLVISRSGASMLAEVAAAGLPSLIVPLVGHARNHQADNAAAFTRTGAGWFVPEHSWESSRVADLLLDRLTKPEEVLHASRKARSFANPNAARDIVRRLAMLAGGHGRGSSDAAVLGR